MPRLKNIRPQVTGPYDALQEFLEVCKARNLADATIEGYRNHAGKIITGETTTWSDAISGFYTFMSQQGIKATTYNIRLRNLKVFLNYSHKQGYLQDNPASKLKAKRVEPKIVMLDDITLRKLIKAPNRGTFVGLRDYTMILLALDTGIRPKEAITLTRDDICLKTQQVNVRAENAKARVSRVLPISPKTARAIKQLLNAHHPEWPNPTVFCSYDGKKLARSTFGRRLQEYSRAAGARIRPYDLRHTFALRYLKAGGDVFSLQRIMGHSDLKMTSHYIALAPGDIKQMHEKFSPLNFLN